MIMKKIETYCGVFKVIKAVICEDEPSALPGFYTPP